MTNGTNTPFGFQEQPGGNSGIYAGAISSASINPADTTTYTIGDLVYRTASGFIAKATPAVTGGSPVAASPILGIFKGAEYLSNNSPNSNPNGFFPGAGALVDAGTPVIAKVFTDYKNVLMAQMSGAGLNQTDIGLNFNYVNTSNTNPNAKSLFTVLSGSGATDATLPLKCVGLAPVMNNAFGNEYNVGLFVINLAQDAPNTAGI